jgi:hypothetical protein
MLDKNTGFLFAAAAVLLALLTAWLSDFRTRRKRCNAILKSDAAIRAFRSASADKRGFLSYSTIADPHTLLVVHDASDAPEADPHTLEHEPCLHDDSESVALRAIEDTDVRGIRFILSDGTTRAVRVRIGGSDSIQHGADYVRAQCAYAFQQEADIMRVKQQAQKTFAEVAGNGS